MPLDTRSIAVSLAVICFFVLSFIGWLTGLSSFACCKRAVIGAVVAYAAVVLAVRAINAILLAAMAANQAARQLQKQQHEQKVDQSDSRD